jgi:hypothetical protein
MGKEGRNRVKFVIALVVGIACGGGSWSLGAALSGTFEPFDSSVGFLTTQAVLAGAAFAAAAKYGARAMLVVVLGGYLGLNLYPYAFGGSESRAWAVLGAITTLSLVVVPLLAGLATSLLMARCRAA